MARDEVASAVMNRDEAATLTTREPRSTPHTQAHGEPGDHSRTAPLPRPNTEAMRAPCTLHHECPPVRPTRSAITVAGLDPCPPRDCHQRTLTAAAKRPNATALATVLRTVPSRRAASARRHFSGRHNRPGVSPRPPA